MSDLVKTIAYIISILLILSLVISILVMDSKSHNKMFDDVNGIIRTDTSEGTTTIVFICLIAYILLNVLGSLPAFSFITDIIPKYAEASQIGVSYMNGIIEMIVFAIVILGLNIKSHDKIFDDAHKRVRDETPEGTATIVFISFIALILITFVMKYLSSSWGALLNPITDNIFYIVILALSFVLWIFNTIFKSIGGFFDSSNGSTSDFIFNDFDAKLIPNYGLLFAMIGVVISVLYTAAYDPKSLTTNTYAYILTIVIPILFAFFYAVPIMSSDNGGGYGKLASIAMTIVMLFAAIYFYINMNSASFELTAYISAFLILLMIIVGLALSVYMLSNYLKSFTGWSGFFVYFIFYIPCLLIDFSKYILKEFQMTSKVIYVLFFIELLLILLYIYVPKLISSIDKKDGIVLVDNGQFLDIQKSIGSSKILQISKDKLENDNYPIVYQTNFAFTMWVYLNVQPTNFSSYSKESPIFDFGNGKPKIVYYNNVTDDIHINKYIIYFTDVKSSENSYEITLPIQKWNNIVFNYKSNQVDLFINGELVKVFKFTDNRPMYKPTDNIVVGSDNGLDGAICNVRFYPYNLSVSHITTTYNLLMYKNPPVVI